MNMSYTYEYPHPALTTDCVIFGFDGKQLNVLLIKRGVAPYKDCWALPGGFMKMDENLDECARRELKEETGVEGVRVEQFATYSDVTRDPRERVVTTAYFALVIKDKYENIKGGDDAADAKWFKIDSLPPLAFDHERIIKDAHVRLSEKVHFEAICFEMLGETFKMSEIQNLYQAILGEKFDRRNFSKKIQFVKVLELAEERPEGLPSRYPSKYKFNKEAYEDLKARTFRVEF